MTYERRPYLPGIAGPRACRVLVGELGAHAREVAEAMTRSADDEIRETGLELLAAFRAFAESARQLRERRAVPAGSADGTTEPTVARSEARFRSSFGGPGLTVQAVAERNRVSPRYIRKLCDDGVLSATKEGREWRIDPGSAQTYELARRSVA